MPCSPTATACRTTPASVSPVRRRRGSSVSRRHSRRRTGSVTRTSTPPPSPQPGPPSSRRVPVCRRVPPVSRRVREERPRDHAPVPSQAPADRRCRTAVLLVTLPVLPAAAEDSTQCTFPSKKYAGRPWSLQRVLMDELWDQSTGKGVRVAVIDTGVDVKNPQLAKAVDAGSGINLL